MDILYIPHIFVSFLCGVYVDWLITRQCCKRSYKRGWDKGYDTGYSAHQALTSNRKDD